MGRTPWSPQSYKQDTMGVGFDLNCPDRSWCVAHVGQHKTKRRHRSGNDANSRRAKRTQERKEKRTEAFRKRIMERNPGTRGRSRCDRETKPLARATPLHSVALRAASAA